MKIGFPNEVSLEDLILYRDEVRNQHSEATAVMWEVRGNQGESINIKVWPHVAVVTTDEKVEYSSAT